MAFTVVWIPKGQTKRVRGPQTFLHLVEAVAFARAIREWAPADLWIEAGGIRVGALSDRGRFEPAP